MRVLAIGAAKGGVAKTTSSLYLAARAAEALGGNDNAVALIDRDESKNLSRLIKMRPNLLRPGMSLLAGEELPRPGSYQLVIIDTPPGLSAIPSLREADLVLVPVKPDDQGIGNLVLYLDDIDDQRIAVSPRMRLIALLPTLVQRTKLHRVRLSDIAKIAAAHEPALMVLPSVPQRASIADFQLTTHEYDEPARELFHHAHVIKEATSVSS